MFTLMRRPFDQTTTKCHLLSSANLLFEQILPRATRPEQTVRLCLGRDRQAARRILKPLL